MENSIDDGSGPMSIRRSSIFELADHQSMRWARHDSLEQLRHRAEFEMLGVLGRGAFGVTFKVKNRVDSKIYALKRVYLGKAIEDDAKKVLREVEVLSSLNSEYVVRYYAAWVEKGQDHASSSETGSQEGSSTNSSWSHSFGTNTCENYTQSTQTQEDPLCHLCKSTYRDWEVSFEQWGLIDAVLQPKFLCISCYKQSLPSHVDECTIRIRETMPLYLFILMEYCESTLQQAVDDIYLHDDEILPEEKQKKGSTRDLLLWRYLSQCVQGLEHCHSNNFIHRDIKTSNIFVHKGVAKLGDLGQALTVVSSFDNEIDPEQSKDYSSSEPRHGIQSPFSDKNPDVSLSSQVGTFLYAAPEVGRSKVYDEKCDIFSLGVVLVEIWSKFDTAMERAHVLQLVHTGQLPKELREENPVVTKLALDMVANNPTERPSCSEILAFLLKEELLEQKNPLLLEQVVADLQFEHKKIRETIKNKERTIRKLRDLLSANNIPHDHIT